MEGGAAGLGGVVGGQTGWDETTALHARASIIVQIPWRGVALSNNIVCTFYQLWIYSVLFDLVFEVGTFLFFGVGFRVCVS